MKDTILAFVCGALAIALFVAIHVRQNQPTQLSGFDSQSTLTLASSSAQVVGPQNIVTIFAANASCADRVISNVGLTGTVMLSFSANVTPSVSIGHPLTASTTQAFLASQYGCGAIRAYAPASTTITRSEYIR